jgi:hypothetical protein
MASLFTTTSTTTVELTQPRTQWVPQSSSLKSGAVEASVQRRC